MVRHLVFSRMKTWEVGMTMDTMMGIVRRTLTGACIVAACGLSQAAQAEPVKIRIGFGGAAEEQMWLLMSKPELAKNNGKLYTIEGTKFQGSDKRAQAFEAGAIDLSQGAANGVIFAAAEGIHAKIIASLARESSKGFSTTFYSKADSGIKTIADMKGKTIGINGYYTSGHLWLRAALEKDGNIKESDVTIARVSFSAMQESLASGKIDIGMFPQPFAALLEKDVKVNKLFDAKYGMPFDEELTVLAGKDEFLQKNRTAIRALLSDLMDVTRYYLAKPNEAKQFLIDAKMVRVSPEVYMSMKDYYRDPTMRPNAEALQQMHDFQVKAGFQKKSVDIKSLVDTSYLPD